MNKVLVLGAGRSSSALIEYLLHNSTRFDWRITVADTDLINAKSKTENHQNGIAVQFNIDDEENANKIVSENDVVISLLPPHLHDKVAVHCIQHKKHLITASYVSEKMKSLNREAIEKGILIMCESGLDPGIDHMSAMQIIDEIKAKDGKIISFKSSCGGLVAPACDNNPWHYKISWNPRNVVLAGQATAQYIDDGIKKFKPYHRLFAESEKLKIKGHGNFESYPNRDSISYISTYGLDGIKTLVRSTLRKENYCSAWNALIQLGLTDDSYKIHSNEKFTYQDWLMGFLLTSKKKESVSKALSRTLGLKHHHRIIEQLLWLGIADKKKIGLGEFSPAQILQQLIEEKWKMKKNDRDMVVMHHEFIYLNGKKKTKHTSSLIIEGEKNHTAMAKTVGLPLGIICKLILQNKISLTGVHIPIMKEVYEPALSELRDHGIIFSDHFQVIN